MLRIIHTSDIHLDSKMNTRLDKQRARMRNNEILVTFAKMVEYAKQNEVSAILISGDLFDSAKVSMSTIDVVMQSIRTNADIHFYYLPGNHEKNILSQLVEDVPTNLIIFDDELNTYMEGNVAITGAVLDGNQKGNICKNLVLNLDFFNIVMLHGQIIETSIKNSKDVIISIRELMNKGIDYLALGHVHKYMQGKLDERGIYCYPGCLEGRGFDECGQHGFVELEIDEQTGKMATNFIPFAKRELFILTVDVTGLQATYEIEEAIKKQIKECDITEDDFLRIVLTGQMQVEAEKDISYLKARFDESFYFVDICDETNYFFNPKDYAVDESLKGEFVRMVIGSDELSEEDKADIIHLGINLLKGEEFHEDER